MAFVADDLAAWLVGLLADAGRRRLTALTLGSEQERALRQAATAAVQVTARELCPDDDARAVERRSTSCPALPSRLLEGAGAPQVCVEA